MCSYVCTYITFPIGEYYFQPLTPIPIIIRYFQPINLTFLVVAGSDGISNDVNPNVVFQYNALGSSVGQHRMLIESTQWVTVIYI